MYKSPQQGAGHAEVNVYVISKLPEGVFRE